jgi:hypothetical protein
MRHSFIGGCWPPAAEALGTAELANGNFDDVSDGERDEDSEKNARGASGGLSQYGLQ